jgi:hypothetical protein
MSTPSPITLPLATTTTTTAGDSRISPIDLSCDSPVLTGKRTPTDTDMSDLTLPPAAAASKRPAPAAAADEKPAKKQRKAAAAEEAEKNKALNAEIDKRTIAAANRNGFECRDCDEKVTAKQTYSLPDWACAHSYCAKCSEVYTKRKADGYACCNCKSMVTPADLAKHPNDAPLENGRCIPCNKDLDDPFGLDSDEEMSDEEKAKKPAETKEERKEAAKKLAEKEREAEIASAREFGFQCWLDKCDGKRVTVTQAASLPDRACQLRRCLECHEKKEKELTERKKDGYTCLDCDEKVTVADIAAHPDEEAAQNGSCGPCWGYDEEEEEKKPEQKKITYTCQECDEEVDGSNQTANERKLKVCAACNAIYEKERTETIAKSKRAGFKCIKFTHGKRCHTTVTAEAAASFTDKQCFDQYCTMCFDAHEAACAKRRADGYSCNDCGRKVTAADVAAHPSPLAVEDANCAKCTGWESESESDDDSDEEFVCAERECVNSVENEGDLCEDCEEELQEAFNGPADEGMVEMFLEELREHEGDVDKAMRAVYSMSSSEAPGLIQCAREETAWNETRRLYAEQTAKVKTPAELKSEIKATTKSKSKKKKISRPCGKCGVTFTSRHERAFCSKCSIGADVKASE